MSVPTTPPSPVLVEPPGLPEVAGEAETDTTAPCRNCGTALTGEYCARCGQRDAPVDLTLGELAYDAWESITNVDGKVVSSLRTLLLRPGALTVEYIAGRRARYLTPVRIYLLCSIVFFIVTAIDLEPWRARNRTPEQVARIAATDSVARARIAAGETRTVLGNGDSAFERRLERGALRLTADGDGWKSIVSRNVPNAMFVFMPLYAALLQLLYRSRRMRFPLHLVFALHAHAFFFAVTAGAEAIEAVVTIAGAPRAIEGTADVLVLAWLAVYFVIALRRVYGGRWRGAVARSLVLANAYPMIIIGVMSVGIAAYLWVLGA
ncbi:MAG: DUF3667 domain-containing protein [Gemmatimonadaceae bacterium]|nr:DUF3667 domain-containing protein [Gemmatimonadaceae bacterium]